MVQENLLLCLGKRTFSRMKKKMRGDTQFVPHITPAALPIVGIYIGFIFITGRSRRALLSTTVSGWIIVVGTAECLCPLGSIRDTVCSFVSDVLICLLRGNWNGCIDTQIKGRGSLPSHQTILRDTVHTEWLHDHTNTHVCLPHGCLWWGRVH